jgi:hypothetical protein
VYELGNTQCIILVISHMDKSVLIFASQVLYDIKNTKNHFN